MCWPEVTDVCVFVRIPAEGSRRESGLRDTGTSSLPLILNKHLSAKNGSSGSEQLRRDYHTQKPATYGEAVADVIYFT